MDWLLYLLSSTESLVLIATHIATWIAKSPFHKD